LAGAGEAPSGVRRRSGSHRRFFGRPRDWSVEADRAPRRWVWAAQALLERLPRCAGVAARAPSLADRDDLGRRRLRRCLVGASDGQSAAPVAATVYSTNDWIERDGALGRWRLRVGEDGKPVGTPELLPMAGIDDGGQLTKASSDFAAWLRSTQGPLGVLYLVDEQRPVERYISAAGKLWEQSDAAATLIQTLEVQSLSGACLGLIVLPTHPLRVAWQQGFDLMVAT
jgi:hypothetical protein